MRYTPEVNRLPVGTQSFEILRSENFVYVDKTEHIYNLVTGGRVYFLSRPRRFGKSLLITTLEAIFRGQHDLFENTWIKNSDYDWLVHPVIRIDMTDTNMDSIETFHESLIDRMADIAMEYQVSLDNNTNASRVLSKLIRTLEGAHGKVVVLIDEYDTPMLDNIADKSLAESMRDTLRQFYSVLKAQDSNIRFVMLTGITKFSKVSVFSGLNNLQDISIAEQYATLCGYTQTELEENFSGWIDNLANTQDTKVDQQLALIKLWYNGYQFSEFGERVYNPFSTLVLFEQQAYKPYWFETGTPKFLIDLFETMKFSPRKLDHIEVDSLAIESHDVSKMGLIALLYQTGYLTIESYDKTFDSYKLTYPNLEVKRAFTRVLLSSYSEIPADEQGSFIKGMSRALASRDFEKTFSILKSFLANIPYEIHEANENYYQTIFYLIFSLLGYEMQVEVTTNIGRIDSVMRFEGQVLIFEFKIDKSSAEALQQIHERKYYQRYQNQDKDIVLFGVNFSTAERNISDWQQEELNL